MEVVLLDGGRFSEGDMQRTKTKDSFQKKLRIDREQLFFKRRAEQKEANELGAQLRRIIGFTNTNTANSNMAAAFSNLMLAKKVNRFVIEIGGKREAALYIAFYHYCVCTFFVQQQQSL